MNYVQRNLIPLTVGLLAIVAIVIVAGTVVIRLTTDDRISDDQLARELERRLDGIARGGNATLGVQLDPELRVTGVVPGGPGEAAGIQVGDQVVAVNTADVKTLDDARTRLAAIPANTEFTVTVQRQGARVDLKAMKGAALGGLGGLFQRFTDRAPFREGRPDGSSAPTPATPPPAGPVLGVSLQPASGGLRVLGVTPNSAAAAAGLHVDDLVLSANGRATPSVEALQEVLRSAGPGSTVAIVVKRGDLEVTLNAVLGPRS